MDRDAEDADTIEVAVEPGSPVLERCAPSCIEYVPKGPEGQGVRFRLPPDFANKRSTIYVVLRDSYSERGYFFYLEGTPVDTSRPAVTVEPRLEVREKYAKLLTAEELDQETRNWHINEEEYCLPYDTQVSRRGRVTIRFPRNLVLDRTASGELESDIVERGAIQLQFIDESGGPVADDRSRDLSWDISFDTQREVRIQIHFADPGAVSTASNTRDRLRILFEETGSWLRCESLLDLIQASESPTEGGRELQAGRDTIPPGYQVTVSLPPQQSLNVTLPA